MSLSLFSLFLNLPRSRRRIDTIASPQHKHHHHRCCDKSNFLVLLAAERKEKQGKGEVEMKHVKKRCQVYSEQARAVSGSIICGRQHRRPDDQACCAYCPRMITNATVAEKDVIDLLQNIFTTREHTVGGCKLLVRCSGFLRGITFHLLLSASFAEKA